MGKTLTLRRQGKFKIEMEGENHCGVAEKQTIKYFLTVVCKAKGSLDDRDYLFEQLNIDNYFRNLELEEPFDVSCERLAINAATELREMILNENSKLKIMSMELELSAKPYAASMTYLHVDKRFKL